MKSVKRLCDSGSTAGELRARYNRVATEAVALKKSVDYTCSCSNACFSDPLLLARCQDCRDGLASAAMNYLKAVRDFRKGVQSETADRGRARRAG